MSVGGGTLPGMAGNGEAAQAERYELTDVDRMILEMERVSWKAIARKHGIALERFGLKETAYVARVQWLLDQPAALEYDPPTVRRLLRLREQRRAQRTPAARGVSG